MGKASMLRPIIVRSGVIPKAEGEVHFLDGKLTEIFLNPQTASEIFESTEPGRVKLVVDIRLSEPPGYLWRMVYWFPYSLIRGLHEDACADADAVRTVSPIKVEIEQRGKI